MMRGRALRRTYASWAHDKGVPGKVVAQSMGHTNADIRSTCTRRSWTHSGGSHRRRIVHDCSRNENGVGAKSFDLSGSSGPPTPGYGAQAGLEPATLRLTGGKSVVSRALPRCAGRCRIGHRRSENRTIFGFRFVPPFAAVCRSLVHRKGKKRATSQEGFPRDDADRVLAKDSGLM